MEHKNENPTDDLYVLIYKYQKETIEDVMTSYRMVGPICKKEADKKVETLISTGVIKTDQYLLEKLKIPAEKFIEHFRRVLTVLDGYFTQNDSDIIDEFLSLNKGVKSLKKAAADTLVKNPSFFDPDPKKTPADVKDLYEESKDELEQESKKSSKLK